MNVGGHSWPRSTTNIALMLGQTSTSHRSQPVVEFMSQSVLVVLSNWLTYNADLVCWRPLDASCLSRSCRSQRQTPPSPSAISIPDNSRSWPTYPSLPCVLSFVDHRSVDLRRTTTCTVAFVAVTLLPPPPSPILPCNLPHVPYTEVMSLFLCYISCCTV